MKSLFIVIGIILGLSVSAQNKENLVDFKKKSPDEKREFFQKLKIDKIVSEFELSGEKEKKVRQLFSEYFQKENELMRKFKPEENVDELTDKEAQNKIDLGFEIAQGLLNNRKLYTQKFLEILTPQQVLKMYKIEKELKNKVEQKHQHRKHEKK